MASNSEISTAISTATAAGITYSDLADLIRRAIASGLTDDGRIVVSTSGGGGSVVFQSLDSAIAALEKVRRLASLESNGGGCVGLAEFR